MKIFLTGATGFAGGEVLRQALLDDNVAQVTVLSRRPLGIVDSKLEVVILRDFLDYSGVALEGFDACIWCLGVSQTQVRQDAYIRITLDYTLAGAKAMRAASPGLRFCFLSGRSADPEEMKSSLQARIKGRTERKLSELGPNIFSFRPGYIRPTAQSGPRKDLARFLAPVGTVMSWFGDGLSVDCDQLARCLLGAAREGASRAVLDNREIRHWSPAP